MPAKIVVDVTTTNTPPATEIEDGRMELTQPLSARPCSVSPGFLLNGEIAAGCTDHARVCLTTRQGVQSIQKSSMVFTVLYLLTFL